MNKKNVVWIILFVLGAGFLTYRTLTTGMGTEYVERVDGYEIEASPRDSLTGAAYVSVPRTVGLWIAALFTLCILSFVYRDNPFYKLAESILIGSSAAYWMILAFWTVFVPNLLGKLIPDLISRWAMPGTNNHFEWIYVIPLILGVLLLCRLLPKGGWISRWSLSFIIGTMMGMKMIAFLQADFLSQIDNTILPLVAFAADGKFSFGETLKNLIIIVGVFSGLVYFFFSVEHIGIVHRVSRVGIGFLMITFGAAFAYTVMGRIALLAQRVEFLFDDWLWIIDPMGKRYGL